MDDTEKLVREVAARIDLPIRNGRFAEIDSLSVVTFIAELERAASVRFPAELMVRETFDSVGTVAQALRAARS